MINMAYNLIASRDPSPTAKVGVSRLPARPGINCLIIGLGGAPEDSRGGQGKGRGHAGGFTVLVQTNQYQLYLRILST